MSEPAPSKKADRFMGVMKGAAIVTAVVIGMGIWRFVQPVIAHDRHKAETRVFFDTATQAQWKQLFDEVKDLVVRNPGKASFPKDQWPSSVVKLKPYTVSYDQGEAWMNWTGGFDDDTLYLYVAITTGQREAGIYVHDSMNDEEQRCVCRPQVVVR